MKKFVLVVVASVQFASAQIGRTFDWNTAAGDAQRTGFEHSDTKFTKADLKDFSLVVKDQLGGKAKGSSYLMPPVVFGTLIGYRGFKELAFVANSTGDVWAIDVDLDRIYWRRHIDLPKMKMKGSELCPAGITADPTMEPGAVFGGRRKKGAAAPARDDFWKKIFAPRTLYVLANDGKLYRLDTSTGKDMAPPVPVMPPGANVSNLNAAEGVIYATTSNSCNGVPNAVWQINLSGDTPKVASSPTTTPEGFIGKNGALLGSDDDVYAQTTNTLQILSPADLKAQQTFSGALGKASPVAFEYKERDVIVTAGNKNSLFLLDTKALSQALLETDPVTAAEGQAISGLASWETQDGDRYVVATVSGSPNGSLVAYQLTEDNGKPVLKRAWATHELSLPETPVVANGVVFTVSAGELGKKGKLTGHAVLYGFDAETGKEIYSTGNQLAVPANRSGLTIANGRVFFSTIDGTFYSFGYHLEH